MSVKAHSVIKNLIAINDEERVLIEDASLRDIIHKDKERRKTFEYAKKDSTVQNRI